MYKKQTYNLILFFFTCCMVSAQNTKIDNEYYSSGKLKGTGTVQIHGIETRYISDGLFDPGRSEERLYTSKIGEWKFYYESGKLKEVGSYKVIESTSYKTGEWKYYHENGKLKETGSYSIDENNKEKRIGLWKKYYPSGKLQANINHKDKNSYSLTSFYENGNIESESTMGSSYADGTYKTYYENGNLEQFVNFDNGVEVGIGKFYEANGDLKAEVDYDLSNGYNYIKRENVKKEDYEKAKELLLKSANRGNNQAEYYLGNMYNSGVGVSVNYEAAKEWYKKSCDKNYYDACNNIAVIILNKEESIINEMNALGATEAENKRYNELKKMRLDVYKEALPYLEKAYSIDSSNEDVKNTITNIKNALNN